MSVGGVDSSSSFALAAFLRQKAATARTKTEIGASSTDTAGSTPDPATPRGTAKPETYTTRESPVEDILAEINNLLSNGFPTARSGRIFDQGV